MTWIKGLDVSFSRISKAWAEDRVTEGWHILVQCLWTGGYQNNAGVRAVAEKNLRDAREAGMICAGYSNANPWFDAARSLAETKANAGTEWPNIKVVFVDVEIPQTTIQQVRELCEALRAEGKIVAIYSARWFWAGVFGNPQDKWLLDYPIWNAYYDGDPDVDFAKAPWGPWGEVAVVGEQYGGESLDGVTVDWNNFVLEFFKGTAEEDWFMALSPEAQEVAEWFFTRKKYGPNKEGGHYGRFQAPAELVEEVCRYVDNGFDSGPDQPGSHGGPIYTLFRSLQGDLAPGETGEPIDYGKLAAAIAPLLAADLAKRIAQ